MPNAFLMSLLLFGGTFLISWHLKKFKFQSFFSNGCRNVISDFAVIIAILTMTTVDYLVQVDTPKLTVPGELRPTWEGRGWLIEPFGSQYSSPLSHYSPLYGSANHGRYCQPKGAQT